MTTKANRKLKRINREIEELNEEKMEVVRKAKKK